MLVIMGFKIIGLVVVLLSRRYTSPVQHLKGFDNLSFPFSKIEGKFSLLLIEC